MTGRVRRWYRIAAAATAVVAVAALALGASGQLFAPGVAPSTTKAVLTQDAARRTPAPRRRPGRRRRRAVPGRPGKENQPAHPRRASARRAGQPGRRRPRQRPWGAASRRPEVADFTSRRWSRRGRGPAGDHVERALDGRFSEHAVRAVADRLGQRRDEQLTTTEVPRSSVRPFQQPAQRPLSSPAGSGPPPRLRQPTKPCGRRRGAGRADAVASSRPSTPIPASGAITGRPLRPLPSPPRASADRSPVGRTKPGPNRSRVDRPGRARRAVRGPVDRAPSAGARPARRHRPGRDRQDRRRAVAIADLHVNSSTSSGASAGISSGVTRCSHRAWAWSIVSSPTGRRSAS